MISLYGEIPDELVIQNADDLINQIFKLLPYKENHDERLEYHFTTLLFRLAGMSKVFSDVPELITVMSLLQAAQSETNFQLYRKAILDSCSFIKKIQEKLDAGSI